MTKKLGLISAIALVMATPLTAQATTSYYGAFITDASAIVATPFSGNGSSAGSAFAPLASFGNGGSLASIEFSFQQVPASVFDIFFTAAANSFAGTASTNSDGISNITLTDVTKSAVVATGLLHDGNLAGINYANMVSGDVYKYEIQLTPNPLANFGSVSAGFNISAVPESEEWAMMMLGLPLLGWVARRKQSATLAI